MDAYKPGRYQRVELFGQDLESVKNELAEHLGRAMQRQGKTTTVNFCRTPMGFEGEVPAQGSLEYKCILPIPGNLSDFGVSLFKGAKNCDIKVTQDAEDMNKSVKRDLKEGFQVLELKLGIDAFSVVTVEIFNQGSVSTRAVVGFTFSEGDSHALLEAKP